MDPDHVVLLEIAGIVSLIVHSVYRQYALASLLSAVVSAVIGLVWIFVKDHFPVQLVASLIFAPLDPGLPCLAVAALVGAPFAVYRKWRAQHTPPARRNS